MYLFFVIIRHFLTKKPGSLEIDKGSLGTTFGIKKFVGFFTLVLLIGLFSFIFPRRYSDNCFGLRSERSGVGNFMRAPLVFVRKNAQYL